MSFSFLISQEGLLKPKGFFEHKWGKICKAFSTVLVYAKHFSTFFNDDKNENDTSSADVFMFADSVI